MYCTLKINLWSSLCQHIFFFRYLDTFYLFSCFELGRRYSGKSYPASSPNGNKKDGVVLQNVPKDKKPRKVDYTSLS